MTSHMLTVCTVASLLLVGQYARLLLANEVTNEVPVPSVNCLYWQTWVRLKWTVNTFLNIVEMFVPRLKRDSPVGKFFVFSGSVLLFMAFVWKIGMIEKRTFILDVSQEWKFPLAITFSFSIECRWVNSKKQCHFHQSPTRETGPENIDRGVLFLFETQKLMDYLKDFFFFYLVPGLLVVSLHYCSALWCWCCMCLSKDLLWPLTSHPNPKPCTVSCTWPLYAKHILYSISYKKNLCHLKIVEKKEWSWH